jgi:hypothetical protein
MKLNKNLLLWNYWANLNQTLLKWSLGGPLSAPSCIQDGHHRKHFGRGPSKDHSTKVWLQLAQWFLRRRFLCEFPIGPYVKLSSAVGAILIERAEPPDTFWKRTIGPMGNSHKNLLLRNHLANCNQTFVEWSLDGPLPKLCPVIPTSNQDGRQAKNRKKGGWNLKKSSPLKLRSQCQPNFAEMILGWHPRIIPQKFGCNWPSGFWGEDFYVNFP